eukprot:2826637-Prymnesium_polylepis.1
MSTSSKQYMWEHCTPTSHEHALSGARRMDVGLIATIVVWSIPRMLACTFMRNTYTSEWLGCDARWHVIALECA